VNTSSPTKTARTRPYNGRAVYTARTRPCMGPAHGPSTPPVYMTVYGPSVRAMYTAEDGRLRPCTWRVQTGRVHGHAQAVHTAVYTTRIRPHTRVYVSTCTRAVYTAVYGPSTRPKTAMYTAVHGRVTCQLVSWSLMSLRVTCRVYGRVRAVSARVHGSVRAVCTAVFGRLHWPCTLPST